MTAILAPPLRVFLRIARAGASLLVAAVLLVGAQRSAASERPALFPRPFVVEHRLARITPDGVEADGGVVTDWYAGSTLVSRRPDGSRLVVDFARRELVEIRAAEGRWWSIGFDRLAELRRRLRAADGITLAQSTQRAAGRRGEPPAVRIEELDLRRGPAGPESAPPLARPGIRRFRSSADRGAGGAIEAWVDPSVRLSKEARDALSTFEDEVLGGPADPDVVSPGALLAAIRERADGAFVVRTRRSVGRGVPAVVLEDVVVRLESVPSLPAGLLDVSDGSRQAAHPLESAVREAEERADPVAAARATTGAGAP